MNEYDKTRRGWYNECKRLMDENVVMAGKIRDLRNELSVKNYEPSDVKKEIMDLKYRIISLERKCSNW